MFVTKVKTNTFFNQICFFQLNKKLTDDKKESKQTQVLTVEMLFDKEKTIIRQPSVSRRGSAKHNCESYFVGSREPRICEVEQTV